MYRLVTSPVWAAAHLDGVSVFRRHFYYIKPITILVREKTCADTSKFNFESVGTGFLP